MEKEQHISNLLQILNTLDESQLYYIYCYIIGYFGIQECELQEHSSIGA